MGSKTGASQKKLGEKDIKGEVEKGRNSDGGKAMETIKSFGGGEASWEGESWLFSTEKASSSYSSHLSN